VSLSLRPTLRQLEEDQLLAVRVCLFILLAATLHNQRLNNTVVIGAGRPKKL